MVRTRSEPREGLKSKPVMLELNVEVGTAGVTLSITAPFSLTRVLVIRLNPGEMIGLVPLERGREEGGGIKNKARSFKMSDTRAQMWRERVWISSYSELHQLELFLSHICCLFHYSVHEKRFINLTTLDVIRLQHFMNFCVFVIFHVVVHFSPSDPRWH